MQEYPPGQAAAQQQGRRLPAGLDPRNYDPRKAIDPQQMQRLVRAQAIARAKAQATSTVFLATTVSLATSAFGVVAALAWNDAIKLVLDKVIIPGLKAYGLGDTSVHVAYAAIVTVIAVSVILMLNRIASSIAKKSAIDAAEADAGSL